jgi:hypothetical protein
MQSEPDLLMPLFLVIVIAFNSGLGPAFCRVALDLAEMGG